MTSCCFSAFEKGLGGINQYFSMKIEVQKQTPNHFLIYYVFRLNFTRISVAVYLWVLMREGGSGKDFFIL